MVSTRGVKLKFSEGEKVLCYEPDPAKTKVLYNSKVISIDQGHKDEYGKRLVKFLIHFQGWNSTWDRKVTEEYVLKDTEENRQLQRELAERAQLTAGGNLYKRERKKRRRKLSELVSESLGACEPPPPAATPPDADSDRDGSVDDPDDADDEGPRPPTPLLLSDELKARLELDCRLVTVENKLVNLPCAPNVVTILENFFKHWAMKKLTHPTEKGHHGNHTDKVGDADSICRSLNVCKEVMDGIRIYFDFTLGSQLLYRQEKEQFRLAIERPASAFFPNGLLPGSIKQDVMDCDFEDKYNHVGEGIRKKSLRSSHKAVATTSHEHTNGKLSSVLNGPGHAGLHAQILDWSIVPVSLYSTQPALPSLLYGATHLARLFVKLPDLVQATSMSDEKLQLVLEHFKYFLKYLEDHPDWFSECHYKDNPDSLSDADH